ncbi:MAG: recombinase family protein, partial [Candidatus Mariimomonas ferrooxydans]
MERMGNMNAIIYIRVSTTEQAEKGYSLKVQEETCLKYALSNSYEVLVLFREEGKSAKTADRPELQKMLKYMNKTKKTVDALIVYKMDRLGRNTHDISSFRLIFDTLGIKLISATEAFDNSSMGNFMQTMLAGMAQYENDLRSERTKSGMMKAVEEGRWTWRAPVGYRLYKSNGKSSLVQDRDEADIVRELFKSFDRGLKGSELILKVNKMGAPLRKQTISKTLRNPIYKGKIKVKDWYGGEEKDGLHEPIVDEELFNRVQFNLGVYKNLQKPKLKLNEDFPLRGILYCPECGNRITGAFSTGRGSKKYPYYRCPEGGCSHGSIARNTVDESFMELLHSLTPVEKEIKNFKIAMKEVWKQKDKTRISETKKIKGRIKTLDKKIDNLINLHGKGLIDEGEFSKRYEPLKIKKQEVTLYEKENETNHKSIDSYLDYGLKVFENLPYFWENSTPHYLNHHSP